MKRYYFVKASEGEYGETNIFKDGQKYTLTEPKIPVIKNGEKLIDERVDDHVNLALWVVNDEDIIIDSNTATIEEIHCLTKTHDLSSLGWIEEEDEDLLDSAVKYFVSNYYYDDSAQETYVIPYHPNIGYWESIHIIERENDVIVVDDLGISRDDDVEMRVFRTIPAPSDLNQYYLVQKFAKVFLHGRYEQMVSYLSRYILV